MPSSLSKVVTRADVAKLAGVSETIVSYVINKNRYVDAQKKQWVENAIKELNYLPNSAARTLKGKKGNHIVFITDDIVSEHFSKLISEMDAYAYSKGYMISLCANHDTSEFVSQIISRKYDGVVISSMSFPEQYIVQLTEARIPIVLLENRHYKKMKGVAYINTGLYHGAGDCMKHLIETGGRNIVYVDRYSAHGNFSSMNDFRYQAFWDEMNAHKLPVSPENIITGATDPEEVTEMVCRRMKSNRPFDTAFCRNDILACITMKALQSIGVRIPGDVAIAGFDNSSLSQFTSPTLTTVSIDREQIGRAAMEILHQMIYERTVPQPRAFTASLIVRESTRS